MKVKELMEIEDWNEFTEVLQRSKFSSEDKSRIIRARWDYLYEKYKPDEAHVRAKREWLRRKDEAYYGKR